MMTTTAHSWRVCRLSSCWRRALLSSSRVGRTQRTTASCSNHEQQAHHHSKAGYRARVALACEWLRTYGYRLAPVNPLRRDGLMMATKTTSHDDDKSAQEIIQRTLPATVRPLVQPWLEARKEDNLSSTITSSSSSSSSSLPPILVGSDEEQVVRRLLENYCSGIGYEMMHCATDEERQFFIQFAEQRTTNCYCNDNDDDALLKLWCWEQVQRANCWEQLLARRYPTCKRFSIEGLEAGILALNTILDTFANSNTSITTTCGQPQEYQERRRVVLGTMHRGRVNVLHTVLQKSAASLLNEWDATKGPTYDDINTGHSADIVTRSGRNLHVSLLSMPAHLESQDAAVNGKAYGHMVSQMLKMSSSSSSSLQSENSLMASLPLGSILDEAVAHSVLPVIVHGDASFCGQGIVSETLQLSTYSGFDCGGTVHVIFNNQIGFTAETQAMRTPRHRSLVSDVALGIRAPVLHVNAERPWDVFRAARLATLYRQRFGKDIVLDIWGFRKLGHNEVDEPRITNVALYQEVDRHQAVARVFAASLPAPLQQECRKRQEQMEAEYQSPTGKESKCETPPWPNLNAEESNNGEWINFLSRPSSSDGVTGIELHELKAALSILSSIPNGFTLSPSTQRSVSRRADLLKMLQNDNDHTKMSSPMVDWATAELLALSTLAREGHFCRLCGQDSQRGTFSQRHAVWHDAVTGQQHHALPPHVQVVDSPLSELGVLGFEHGISLASPNFLVLWEAQFGDFVNNSQVLIDTMISSEKEKFGLESNLVLLLPHGYDGMGPEHSSARLVRFLTLHTDTPEAAEFKDDLERFRSANFTVVYPSVPSNFFHVLRRSVSWQFRRPMVVLTPKRTLRLPRATSPLAEFVKGSQPAFLPVLDDPRTLDASQVESVALCSGEVFYDILKLVEDFDSRITETVAIVRVEQLAPFPLRQVKAAVDQYPRARRAVWIQEEPRNMGALSFVAQFLPRIGIDISAPISRPVSAAPAVGNPQQHEASQHDLLTNISDWIKHEK